MEIWKDIEGYPHYQVSNKGHVRSAYRIVNHWQGGEAFRRGRTLKTPLTADGYPTVGLYNDKGGPKIKRVHRLVAEAFIPNPELKRTVNHKGGNKVNNRVDNLEWATMAEQNRHAFDARLKKAHGMKSGKAVSPSGQVFFFDNISEFCRIQGLHNGNFCRVLNKAKGYNQCKGWTRVNEAL